MLKHTVPHLLLQDHQLHVSTLVPPSHNFSGIDYLKSYLPWRLYYRRVDMMETWVMSKFDQYMEQLYGDVRMMQDHLGILRAQPSPIGHDGPNRDDDLTT